MTTMTLDAVVPARDRRAMGVLAGVALGVIAAAAMLSCAHKAPAATARAPRGALSPCLTTARSCADVARCAPEVACTEMTTAQARREGLVK